MADTSTGRETFLRPGEYDSARIELLSARRRGERVLLFDASELGFPLLADALSSPLSIYFELTKKCNGWCVQCFADSNSARWGATELPFSEVERVIREFSRLGGFYVRLTGGEPTTRGDFLDILDVLNEEGIVVGLNTNGLFTESMLHAILARGVKDIRVSLDGPEEINDTIRGEGTFARIMRTLHGLAAYNKAASEPTDVTVNVVLMKSNQARIEEMIELAAGLGFRVSFGLLRLIGRALPKEMLSPEEVVRAAHRVQMMRNRLGLPAGRARVNYDIFCEEDPPPRWVPPILDNSQCHLSVSGLSVDAFGRIFPCGYMVGIEEWAGENVLDNDVLALWHNSVVLRKSRQTMRPGCTGCRYHVAKCNGGCPVMAYAVSGDVDGADPYCVRGVRLRAGSDGRLLVGDQLNDT